MRVTDFSLDLAKFALDFAKFRLAFTKFCLGFTNPPFLTGKTVTRRTSKKRHLEHFWFPRNLQSTAFRGAKLSFPPGKAIVCSPKSSALPGENHTSSFQLSSTLLITNILQETINHPVLPAYNALYSALQNTTFGTLSTGTFSPRKLSGFQTAIGVVSNTYSGCQFHVIALTFG